MYNQPFLFFDFGASLLFYPLEPLGFLVSFNLSTFSFFAGLLPLNILLAKNKTITAIIR